MTIEETIEYWERLLKTFSCYLKREENYFGRMHLQTTIDVLDTTISALRDQQEHRRPCDLCGFGPPSSMNGKPCTMCPAIPMEDDILDYIHKLEEGTV